MRFFTLKKDNSSKKITVQHLRDNKGDHHIEKMLWIVIAFIVASILLWTISGAFSGSIANWYNNTIDGWFDENTGMYVTSGGGEGSSTPTNVVPEGGIYYVGVTSTDVGDYTGATDIYYPGDTLPATVSYGDVYVYGDYEYRYNQVWMDGWTFAVPMMRLRPLFSEGWGVRVLDSTQENYGDILNTINGQPVTNIVATFAMCDSLVNAPEMPSNAIHLYLTFSDCISLQTAPIIPEGVKDLNGTFYNCTSLAGAITINTTQLLDAGACLYNTQVTEILGSCQDEVKSYILATVTEEW